ncbi:MAG: rod shape-determining protein RodA [Saprospiraceae bacterium]|nr:rod shape-determining protein RodA [Saprospiraceae bacterium]MDW8482739.1 rod shape-determining protein RodA [Saprospiraceae bacterium]
MGNLRGDFRRTATFVGELDYVLLVCYLALVAIGWLMIYSTGSAYTTTIFTINSVAGKQLLFVVLCMVLMFFIQMSDWSFWRTFGIPIYLISLVVLSGTLVFGREVNGATAWYQFGPFSFQPSEFVKFSTCLAMASYLSGTGVTLRETRTRLIAFALFLIPAFIILLQKDTGSALVFFSFLLVLYREGLPGAWYAFSFGSALMIILGLIYSPIKVSVVVLLISAGRIAWIHRMSHPWWLALLAIGLTAYWAEDLVRWLWGQAWFASLKSDFSSQVVGQGLGPALAIGFWLVVFFKNFWKKNLLIQRRLYFIALVTLLSCGMAFLSGFAYSALPAHQQQRIRLWLNPSEAAADARGSAYNLLHSQMAIGSGGFWGKGLFEGNMTKLKYVPEQSTDFIFCTIGEEQGFVGVAGIIGLFFTLLHRITQIAERQRSNFSRIYAYSVAGIIFVHVVINLGMTMGLFPIIGIPLPFISAGGSSLIGFTLMVGVLLKLDSRRNLA